MKSMNLTTTLLYFALAAVAGMSFIKGINGNTTYTTEVYSNRPDITTSILLTTGINSAITTKESQRCDNSISCGGNFAAPFGSIVSPCYPYKDYPTRKNCDYFINVPGALKIILNIIDFSLEPDAGWHCDEIDNVEVLQNDRRIGLLCSNMTSEPDTLLNDKSEITVPGDNVSVKFTSDVASTAKGFNISYTAKFTASIILVTSTGENMSSESITSYNVPTNNLLQTWEIALIAAVLSLCLIAGGVVTIVCVRKRKRTEVVTQESEDMVERADGHINKKQERTEDDDQML